MSTSAVAFQHFNLNDVDDSAKPVDTDIYTLEVNKLEYKDITIKKGTPEEAEVVVIKGSFTIVDHETYSGRKLWSDFWMQRSYSQKALKRLMNATGVIQQDGEEFPEWAAQFATLNPSARFQVQVTKAPPYNDPQGDPVNEIKFFTSKPC